MVKEPAPEPAARAGGIGAASTLIVMAGILAGNLTGFGREIVTAAVLGASREADIYLIAFAIPELFIVLTLTIVAPALVPAVVAGARGGDFGRLVFALGFWATALLTALAVLLEFVAPLLLATLFAGLSAEETERVILLTRIMLIGVAFLGVSATAIAALTAERRFAGPALVTAAYNLAFLAVVWLGYPALGLPAFGWAVVAGAVVGAVVLLAFVRAGRLPLRPALRHPGVARAFRFAAPVALGYALHHLAFFADRAIGSYLPPGELAALNYAFRLAMIVEQAAGIAVATVALPALADQIAGGQIAAARATLAGALRFVALLAWPAMGFLVIYAGPVVNLVYRRGEFDAAAAELTALALVVFAGGLLADTLAQPVWRYFYAVEAGGTVVWVNAGKTVVRVALNLLFVPLIGFLGIALSSTIGLTAQFVLLTYLAARGLGGLAVPGFASGLVRALAAGTAALGAAWLVRLVVLDDPWLVLLGAAAATIVFFAAARVLHVSEVADLLRVVPALRRRIG